MGLDTTHDCWHGSYSSFHSWRTWLAAQIGLPLEQMQGFSGDKPGIPWSLIRHPLVPLLSHSDCDGKISWKEARAVYIGLALVLRDAETDRRDSTSLSKGSDYDRYITATRRFARGCMDAHIKREDIIFS